MPRPPRRKDEIRAAQDRILSAAATVFAAKGFSEASVQEIAEAAGYSAPSLYTYFKGKQAVLDALVERIVSESNSLFDLEFPAGLTFAQRLELLSRQHNAWAERHRDAFMFLAQRGGAELAKLSGKRDRFIGGYLGRLSSWLEANAGDGDLGDWDTLGAAYVFWGIQHAHFVRWMQEGGSGSLNDDVARVIDVFLHGVRGAKPSQDDA